MANRSVRPPILSFRRGRTGFNTKACITKCALTIGFCHGWLWNSPAALRVRTVSWQSLESSTANVRIWVRLHSTVASAFPSDSPRLNNLPLDAPLKCNLRRHTQFGPLQGRRFIGRPSHLPLSTLLSAHQALSADFAASIPAGAGLPSAVLWSYCSHTGPRILHDAVRPRDGLAVAHSTAQTAFFSGISTINVDSQ